MGCADDDVGDGGRDADLDARVALLGQLALEELVELGVEDTVCARLAACQYSKPFDMWHSRTRTNCAGPVSKAQCCPVLPAISANTEEGVSYQQRTSFA